MASVRPTGDGSRRARCLGRAAATILAALATLAVPGSLATAASPPPVSPPGASVVQAWLDAQFITPDAPPGGVLEAGVTFWDPATNDFAPVDGVFARLRPAKGKAAAAEGTVEADFPGHVHVRLVVPKGGPGSLVVGIHTPAGDEILRLRGTGPPLTATADQLVAATFHPFVPSIEVGRAYPVAVDIQPRGDWEYAALPSLAGLSVVASVGGQQVATAPLTEDGAPGTPYHGLVNVPEPGAVELSVALTRPDGSVGPVAGTPVSVTAAGGDRPSSAPAETAAPGSTVAPSSGDEGIPTGVWLALAALLVVIVGWIAWRAVRER